MLSAPAYVFRIDDCDKKTLQDNLEKVVVNASEIGTTKKKKKPSIQELRQIYRDLLYESLREWKEKGTISNMT